MRCDRFGDTSCSIAADVDPDVAELRATVELQRRSGARSFVDHLAGQGGLRPDVTPDEAADWCCAHMTAVLYRKLVVQQGWPEARYMKWLTDAISAALLG